MAHPTQSDIMSSLRFAENQILAERLKGEKDPFFKNIETTTRDWLPEEINLNGLSGKLPPKFIHKFKEEDCKGISCFPMTNTGEPCNKESVPYETTDSVGNTFSGCQTSCFHLSDKTPLPELVWRNGKCIVGNTPQKIYALFPRKRARAKTVGVTDVPPFVWKEDSRLVEISKAYCRYFDTGFEIDDCVIPPVQRFFENYIAGKTLVRMIVKSSRFLTASSATDPGTNLLVKMAKVIKFSTQQSPEMNIDYITSTLPPDHVFKVTPREGPSNGIDFVEMAEVLSGQIGVSVSATLIKNLCTRVTSFLGKATFNSTVGVFLRETTDVALESVIRALISEAVVKAVTASLVSSIEELVTSFIVNFWDPLGWVILGVSIIGAILDIVDVYHYNEQFGKKELETILNTFKQNFEDRLKLDRDGFLEYTPDIAFYTKYKGLEKDQTFNVEKMIFMMTYLKLLKYNSLGQLVNLGKAIPSEKQGGYPDAEIGLIIPVTRAEIVNQFLVYDQMFRKTNRYEKYLYITSILTAISLVVIRKHEYVLYIAVFLWLCLTYIFVKYVETETWLSNNYYEGLELALTIFHSKNKTRLV